MSDMFFCITLSSIVIAYWLKHQHINIKDDKPKPSMFDNLSTKRKVKPPVKSEADKKREREIADLKRQGYTDELIAVIIPTINNGG